MSNMVENRMVLSELETLGRFFSIDGIKAICLLSQRAGRKSLLVIKRFIFDGIIYFKCKIWLVIMVIKRFILDGIKTMCLLPLA